MFLAPYIHRLDAENTNVFAAVILREQHLLSEIVTPPVPRGAPGDEGAK